jgi:hypothetical protein
LLVGAAVQNLQLISQMLLISDYLNAGLTTTNPGLSKHWPMRTPPRLDQAPPLLTIPASHTNELTEQVLLFSSLAAAFARAIVGATLALAVILAGTIVFVRGTAALAFAGIYGFTAIITGLVASLAFAVVLFSDSGIGGSGGFSRRSMLELGLAGTTDYSADRGYDEHLRNFHGILP